MATNSAGDPPRAQPLDQAPSGIDQEIREREAIRHVTDHLAADYADDHPAEEVEQVVSEKRDQYADAQVRDFVPILVEREVRETLDEAD